MARMAPEAGIRVDLLGNPLYVWHHQYEPHRENDASLPKAHERPHQASVICSFPVTNCRDVLTTFGWRLGLEAVYPARHPQWIAVLPWELRAQHHLVQLAVRV